MLLLHIRCLLFWSLQPSGNVPGKQIQGGERGKQAQWLGALHKPAIAVVSGIRKAIYHQLMTGSLSSIYSLLHDFGKHRIFFWQFLICFPESLLQIWTLGLGVCSGCSRATETSSQRWQIWHGSTNNPMPLWKGLLRPSEASYGASNGNRHICIGNWITLLTYHHNR